MTQSFTCYSVYLFIIWFRNLMCTLLVLSRVANFTRLRVYQNAGPMHHCLSVEPTSTIFCTYYISTGPRTHNAASFLQNQAAHTYLRHRLEPVYYDVAPHAVVLLQTLPPHSSSVFFKRTREKPICSGGAFKKRICSGDPYPRVP